MSALEALPQLAQAVPPPPPTPKEDDVRLLARLIFAEGANHHDRTGAMEGIGWAVANRVGAPGFPKTLEGVIYQPGQFHATRGKLWADAANPASLTGANAKAYVRALETAQGVLDKRIADPIEGAQFFYSGRPGADAPKGFFSDGLANNRLEKVKGFGDFTFVRDRRR